MKNRDLIKKLSLLDFDMEVCIGDYRKNSFHADEDGSGRGIYPDFKIETLNKGVNIPFISLTFDNEDYTEDGDISPEMIDQIPQ